MVERLTQAAALVAIGFPVREGEQAAFVSRSLDPNTVPGTQI